MCPPRNRSLKKYDDYEITTMLIRLLQNACQHFDVQFYLEAAFMRGGALFQLGLSGKYTFSCAVAVPKNAQKSQNAEKIRKIFRRFKPRCYKKNIINHLVAAMTIKH